jgi:sensor histidine kinase regulating citrate/malate metabolism
MKLSLNRRDDYRMEDHEVCEETITLLRRQRHDFINHLQVIHAMLQMGRTEKTLIYIEELAKDPKLVSDVLKDHEEQLDCPYKDSVVL